MRFALIIAIIGGLTIQSATGWTIPEGTGDVVYSVTVLSDGTEIHTRIGNITGPISQAGRRRTATLAPGQTLTARDTLLVPDKSWNLDCWTDEPGELDHADCDAANDALDAQCRDGAAVEFGKSFYSISKCAVAYFCHFYTLSTTDDAYCYEDERAQTSRLITDRCGWYKPGSAWRIVGRGQNGEIPTQWYKESYGYEDYCSKRGSNFCGMAPT